MSGKKFKIVVCRGPECGDRRNAKAVHAAFAKELAAAGVSAELAWQSCFGRCSQGPNALVREQKEGAAGTTTLALMPGPRGVTALYNHLDVQKVARIVAEHVQNGKIIREFIERPAVLFSSPVELAPAASDSNEPPGTGEAKP